MKSTFAPVISLAVVIILTYWVGGIYGIALAAVGMISFVASTIAVDMLGPIIDNAGGICEMANLSDDVRRITDGLDSIGNTTEAVAKGYAIASAALSTVSLFAAFLYSQINTVPKPITDIVLNIAQPMALTGIIVGAAVPYLFSGALTEAVSNAARLMITEVRRQLKIDPSILRGEKKPDYRQCIDISSRGAIRRMKGPAFLGIGLPIAGGFLFGPDFVGGMIVGTAISGVMLAFFTANSGGSWNSGKNLIEKGRYGGKGSPAHRASVIGDTLGDALKDTIAPSLDILIKVLAVVSLLIVSIIKHYNVLGFVGQ
jgi:K(+)-stimulated pyrophosphate-energized sodium pump